MPTGNGVAVLKRSCCVDGMARLSLYLIFTNTIEHSLFYATLSRIHVADILEFFIVIIIIIIGLNLLLLTYNNKYYCY